MNKKTTEFLMRKVLLLSAIFFLALNFSCKKDGKLTPDFDSGNLSILFTDTFSLTTSVVLDDSLRTDLAVSNMLGIYNDPIFGPVSSSIYTQIILTGVNVDFGATPTLDSVVLTLDYDGLHGDTGSQMSVNVYELSTQMDKSTDYYSNTYLAYNPTALGSVTFKPNLIDDVSLGFDTIKRDPHLRIKLSNTFGQSLLNADATGSNDLANNTSFTSFMKGFYITTTDSVSNTSLLPEEGSILSFNLNSSLSTLTLYYNDTSKYDFTINTDAEKYSRFAHNYTGTDVEAHYTSSPSRDTTVTYISAMSGVKTKLEIPHIKNLASDGPVIINKAELVLTLDNGSDGNFDVPLPSLSIVGIDASGDAFFLPDFFEGIDYYDGRYDDVAKTYTFNIARYINQLVYNTPVDYGMYIVANGASVLSNRTVVGSQKSVVSKMRLNITYSKL
jgi:hypothetical protein